MAGLLNPRDFFLLKIAALLHDPPDKAWHVTGKLRESHEKVREQIAAQLLGKPFVHMWFKEGELKDRVVKADRLESAIDRWLTSIVDSVVRKDPSEFGVVLVNPLSGESIYSLKPEERIPEKWINRLRKAVIEATQNLDLNETDLWKYRYHLLFALAEASYYSRYPGCAGPADTRAPHHTVFDHLYATVSIANWFSSAPEPRGFLVRLDFAGVQRFIRASRKLRDLWFSSWFVSTTAWYIIEEVIEHIGPDCLLMPTARWNPFYYRWLIKRLDSLGYDVRGYIEGELSSFHFPTTRKRHSWGVLHIDEPVSIIPGTLLLILPDYPVLARLMGGSNLNPEAENPTEELVRYFCRRYREFFRYLLECVEGAVKSKKKNLGKLGNRIEEAFEKLRELGVQDVPPLALRIAIVKVPEDVEERLKRVVEEMLRGEGVHERCREEERMRWLYCVAIEELERKWKHTKVLKGAGSLTASFDEYTYKLWNRKVSYRFCTICGELPAVLLIPRRRTIAAEGESYEEVVPERYRTYFDEGENFCPYCLVKRLATIDEVLGRSLVVTIAGGEEPGQALTSVIRRMVGRIRKVRTTSWYAVYPFLESFSEALPTLSDGQRRWVREKLDQYARSVKRRAERLPTGLERELLESGVRALEKLSMHELPDEAEEVEGLLAVGVPPEVIEKLERVLGRKIPFSAYYALVRADGDSIGKLLAGNLKEALGLSEIDLLMHVVRSGPYEVKELEAIYEELRRALIKLESLELAPIWPSYHVLISRALMLTALRDFEFAEQVARPIEGSASGTLVVYAGGDDLLAISAPVHALELVRRSRRAYSEGDGLSFHTLYVDGSPVAYLPAMGHASRSYALTLRHFKYPLFLALEASALEIDERAKRARLTVGTWAKEKDSLAISYVPRGGGKSIESVLPLSSTGSGIESLEALLMVLRALQWGHTSTSLIYELNGIVSKYDEPARGTGELRSYYTLLQRAVSRNVVAKPELVHAITVSLCEKFKPLIGAVVNVRGAPARSILYQLSRALWALMSGLRVREV